MKAHQWLTAITLIVICLVSSPAHCFGGSQCQSGVIVKFGNGVWNHRKAAERSLFLLQDQLEQKISGSDLEGLVEYDLSFNPSEGKLLDLLETYGQNRRTDWTQFWRYLAALDLMPDFLQDKIQDMASTVDAAAIQANPAVQKHIANYNALLSEGNKVVLVAHSQGNLFANIAYPGIDPEYIDSFGIVSIGNPDNYVADDGPYTTLTEDIVIGIVPFSLPANVNNFFGINWHDWSGHKFADSYMAPGREAEAKILDDTIETINKLDNPRPCEANLILFDLYGRWRSGLNYAIASTVSGTVVWNYAKNELHQVPKAGGGFWEYPISSADRSTFLYNLRDSYGGALPASLQMLFASTSNVVTGVPYPENGPVTSTFKTSYPVTRYPQYPYYPHTHTFPSWVWYNDYYFPGGSKDQYNPDYVVPPPRSLIIPHPHHRMITIQ